MPLIQVLAFVSSGHIIHHFVCQGTVRRKGRSWRVSILTSVILLLSVSNKVILIPTFLLCLV
jgi:hypothetical protein